MSTCICGDAATSVQIITDRLLLRELQAADEQVIAAYCVPAEVRRYMLPNQGTPEATRRFVQGSLAHARRQPRAYYGLGLVLRAENRLIGTCVLSNVTEGGAAMIGWDLNRHYWGRGLMTEAVRTVIGFAFEQLPVRCIMADCFRANRASIRVMEKVGMRRQELSLLDQYKLFRRYRDWRLMVRHTLFVQEWRQIEQSGVTPPQNPAG